MRISDWSSDVCSSDLAQAFPSFGSERTGAPVVAFCRIDDHEIRLREPIMVPDVLIVQDPTLLHQIDVFQGLQADGYVLINSRRSFDELGLREIQQRYRRERLEIGRASCRERVCQYV